MTMRHLPKDHWDQKIETMNICTQKIDGQLQDLKRQNLISLNLSIDTTKRFDLLNHKTEPRNRSMSSNSALESQINDPANIPPP